MILIDTTAFYPATEEQVRELSRLAKALGYKPITGNWTRGEAATAIAMWSSKLAETIP